MKKFLFITFLHYVLLSTKIVSQTSYCFAPATAYYGGSGIESSSSTTGDFNNDGIKDVASTNEGGGNHIAVMYGLGNGSFGTTTLYPNGGINARSIVSADFNNDGISDIASPNGSGVVSILLGTNTGTLSPMINVVYAGTGSYIITAGDYNNDANIDLAVKAGGTGVFKILLGLGTGSFSIGSNISTGATPSTGILTADFDGDGNLDLATTNSNLNNVDVLLGNGSGTFTNTISFNTESHPEALCSKDFNGDGKDDLAIANGFDGVVSVFLTSSTGLFNPKVDYNIDFGGATSSTIWSIVSGDFDGDNILDLGVGGNQLSICLGTGGGIFAPPSVITTTTSSNPVYTYMRKICTDDFDGDLKYDLALPNGSYNTVLILVHCAPQLFSSSNFVFPTCYGQCNGELYINIANGQPPYDVFLSNGTNVNTTSASLSFTTLCPGVYSYTVNDANSATITNSFVITSYSQIVITSPLSYTSCSGSCSTISLTASGGTMPYSFAYTHNFSPFSGSGSTITVCPTSTNIYTIQVTDYNACTSSPQIINAYVDNTCADVWPGDANSDGSADNLDILELGLHYTQAGVPRATTSNTWQSHFANNWTGTITNGKNLNHSDCNGDGIINNDDTLAIYNNYGLSHAFKPAQTTTVNPQLSIVPDQSSLVKGTWGTASIYLGDATTNISNINGLAFTIDFDNTLIETNSIYIEYQNSFLNAGQNLNFRKLDFANGMIYTATTHTLGSNVSGFGKIATLHYQITSSLNTDEVLSLGLSQVNQSDASGNIVSLTSGNATLMAIGASVGLQVMNGNFIAVSPNPSNGFLTVNSKTELQKIEVLSVTGQVVLTEIPTSTSYDLHLESFAKGIYFVNVYQNDRIVKREKIVLNK